MKGMSLCLVLVLSLCMTGRSSPTLPKASSLSLRWLESVMPSTSKADVEEFRRQSEEQMQHALMRHSARAEVAATDMTVIVQTLGSNAVQEIHMFRYDILANIIGAALYLSNPTFVVVVPSFVSSIIADQLPGWVQVIADAYVGNDASVVITVNWNNVVPTGTMNYYQLVIYALAVARELAILFVNVNDTLNAMDTPTRMNTDMLQLVGFGIGAHIAGVFGSKIKGVARITGLDPSGPYFEDPGRDPSEFLNSASAKFVDIIHTNGGSLEIGATSFFAPVGDVDYYVNGGTEQPGCENGFFYGVGSVINHLVTGEWLQNSCASERAITIFTEAIKSDLEPSAFTCANYDNFANGECLRNSRNVLGLDVSNILPGQFFLNTMNESPFLAEPLELVVEPVSPVGNIDIKFTVSGPDGYTYTIPNIVDAADQGQNEIMGLVLAPLGTAIEDLDFSIQYEKPFWCFWCPNQVEIQQIMVTRTDLETFQTLFAYFQCGLWLATSFNILLFLLGISPCNGLA